MSYGLRNTIILLSVLILFVGSAWGYIYFFQQPEIEELEQEVEQKQTELNEKQQIADQYPVVSEQFEQASDYLENFDKSLYRDNNEDQVYHFLNTINNGSAYTDFTFSFSDSTTTDTHGEISMQVTGEGYYRNVINFIRRIELSDPINKIQEIQINPINNLESYGKVNFTFTLKSLYDREAGFENTSMAVTDDILGSVYNPFFPLIRDVEENEDNLIDVESSSLIAVSGNRVFLLDQSGMLRKLTPGDEVYLGELRSLNVDRGSATFVLNKGGIIEQIDLRVNDEENDSEGN
ncbi:MAG: type 4a pilus biogenesis protein PilO [Bacteroidota bacterium]